MVKLVVPVAVWATGMEFEEAEYEVTLAVVVARTVVTTDLEVDTLGLASCVALSNEGRVSS